MVAEGYKETEIGVIPVEWEVKSLSEIGSFSKGKGISKNEVVESGIPCIRYAEIYTKYDTVLKNIKSFINEESALNSKKIANGDILFAGSGETLDDIGKSVAFIDDFEAYVGGDTVILSPTINYNPLFMSFQLNSTSVRTQLRKLGQGSSVVHIYSSGLEKVVIPFPPLKEQEKIADILSTVDEKIDVIEGEIQKAETLKKGLLQKLLSEGINHSEFKDSELGKIPESWEVVELATLMKVKHGYAFKSNHFSTEETNNIVLTPGNVNIGGGFKKKWFRFYDDEPFPNEYILKNNDIIISMTDLTPTAKTLGFPFIISPVDNKTFLHNQRLGKIEFESLNIFPQFMFNFLCSNRYRNNIVNGSTGTTVRHTSPSRILEEKIALPPLKEQKQIADILSTADEKLEVLRAKKEKYETLKKGLLQKLLSGEVI